MYMLDTNIVIHAIRYPDLPLSVLLRNGLRRQVRLSSIVYAELEYGIHKSKRQEYNCLAMQRFLYGIPILDFDTAAAEHFGDIYASLESQGARIGDRDTLIAAHARSLGFTLVTHNTREFRRVRGLTVEDWLESPPA